MYDGLSNNLSNMFMLSNARSRSISPENPTGEPGRGGACKLEDGSARNAARDLGTGWKVNPYIVMEPGNTYEIADITGPGCINHIWLTPTGTWRDQIIRFYWDGQETPSVEAPLGDFFCCGWNQYAPVRALPVCVNPGSAFNCYWQMPFRKHCRITVENRGTTAQNLYYQID